MNDLIYPAMHILHVVFAIIWIGGLAFITLLVLPMITKMANPLEKALLFQRIEHRFAPMARIYSAAVGVTGFAMFFLLGLQEVVFRKEGHFLLFMIAVWIFWIVMLFGLEPLVVKKMLDRLAAGKGGKLEIEDVFKRMNVLHDVLLLLSLGAAAAGIIFAHGFA